MLISLLEIALATLALAAGLGYFLGRLTGALTLFVLAALAAGVCLAGAARFGTPGLLVAILLITAGAALAGSRLGSGRRGMWFFSLLWLGWCTFSWFGYRAGGAPGFILITLPSVALLWGGAYAIAQQLLPLEDTPSPDQWQKALHDLIQLDTKVISERPGMDQWQKAMRALIHLDTKAISELPGLDQRRNALRALITYTMGTNYPYFTLDQHGLICQAAGDVRRGMFAGPGIILTSCDHLVVTSITGTYEQICSRLPALDHAKSALYTRVKYSHSKDRVTIWSIQPPGLSFTGQDESPLAGLDLRFQQRCVEVKAMTQDGIHIRVNTCVRFRLYADQEQPALGKSFPFRREAIFKALTRRQPIEPPPARVGALGEEQQQRTWDEPVSVVAAKIVRHVIGGYSFDDLGAPGGGQNPRRAIVDKVHHDLENELDTVGIQVIDVGMDNFTPIDNKFLQQRVAHWQAQWARRMVRASGGGDEEYSRIIEAARFQAQAEMIRTISESIGKSGDQQAGFSTETLLSDLTQVLEAMRRSSDRRSPQAGA